MSGPVVWAWVVKLRFFDGEPNKIMIWSQNKISIRIGLETVGVWNFKVSKFLIEYEIVYKVYLKREEEFLRRWQNYPIVKLLLNTHNCTEQEYIWYRYWIYIISGSLLPFRTNRKFRKKLDHHYSSSQP